MNIFSMVKSYGYLILSGAVGFLAVLLKLSKARSERLEQDRDIYKAKYQHHHDVAVSQQKTRENYQRRRTEVTKDEKTMDDRLAGDDNWSDGVSDDSKPPT